MMLRLAVWWECLKARQDGQGMTEYGLILALIAVVLILVLTNMGTALKEIAPIFRHYRFDLFKNILVNNDGLLRGTDHAVVKGFA
jgi:pilus assembly protein Flp/PilA